MKMFMLQMYLKVILTHSVKDGRMKEGHDNYFKILKMTRTNVIIHCIGCYCCCVPSDDLFSPNALSISHCHHGQCERRVFIHRDYSLQHIGVTGGHKSFRHPPTWYSDIKGVQLTGGGDTHTCFIGHMDREVKRNTCWM